MQSKRQRFLSYFFRNLLQVPHLVVALGLFCALLSVWYALTHLQLNANYDELVSERLDYHKRHMDFLREFGDQEYIYAVIEKTDEKLDKAFIEKFAQRLQNSPEITQVIWKLDQPALEKNFLLYLQEPQLKSLQALAGDGAFSLSNLSQWDSFADLFRALRLETQKPVTATQEDLLENGFRFLDGTISALRTSLAGQNSSFHPQQLFLGDASNFDPDGFLKSAELYFVLIMPKKDFATMEVIEKPLAQIRQALAETKLEFPQVTVGLTGKPVLAADEIAVSNQDNTTETALGFTMVGLMFMFFLRNVRRPLLAMFALAVGISWTFGAVTLFFGELNILSMVFSLVLVGAGVEYFIHLIAHYQEFRHHNPALDVPAALHWALMQTGVSSLTSAATTAAAFLTLIWTPFLALAQLGLIAALGILLCLLSAITFLPCLLLLLEKNRAKKIVAERRVLTLAFFERIYLHQRLLGVTIIFLVAVSAFFALRVRFDNNLLNLQADGLESVRFERKIIEKSSESTWFAHLVLPNAEETEKYAERFRALPSVRKVEDLSSVLPSHQAEKKQALGPIQAALANYQVAPRKFLSGENLREALKQEIGLFVVSLEALQAKAFSAGKAEAMEELDKILQKLNTFQNELGQASADKLKNLENFQSQFFSELDKLFLFMKANRIPPGVTQADFPQILYQRFVSPKGSHALWIYPKEDIWEPAKLQQFIQEMRSVHPHVLGTPVEVYESGHLMRETFAISAVLAFVLMFALVYWDFRSWKPAFLAMLSPAVGTLWLVALMELFGVSFNMANFFSIPILLAVGVDSGVHLVHRMLRDGETRVAATATGTGILLTMIANALGMGSLMLASHKGLASFGVIMTLGSITYLLAVFFVIPAASACLLRLPVRRNEHDKKAVHEIFAA